MRHLHIYRYSCWLLGLLALLPACRRQEGPVREESLPLIRLGGEITGTKAMLNEGGLDVDQTKLQVYDYLSGFTGEINGTSYTDADVEYFDDQIRYDGASGEWVYDSGKEYRWTLTGTHNFFGWLTYDKGSDLAIPAGVTCTDRIVTVPQREMTASSPQFDFSYARQIVSRSAESKDYSKVKLELAHLYAAIALTVENKSSEPVTINSITMPNLPTLRGATLDFTGNASQIASYTTPQVGTPFFTNPFSSGMNLSSRGSAGSKVNVFTGAVVSAEDRDFRMIWPLGSEILSPTTPNPYEGVAGNRYQESANNPADSLIRISYSYQMTIRGVPTTITREDIGVKFPSTLKFEPGKKYALNVTVNDKVVALDFVVQDWTFNEYTLEFTSDAATVPDSFTFIDNTYDHKDGKKYYTNGASPIQGKFRITNPIGAKIMAMPIGDTQYFNVRVTPDVVDPTVNNGEILVTIAPNTAHTPTGNKTLQLSFSLMNGTRETNIDSEVRGNDLVVVWAN